MNNETLTRWDNVRIWWLLRRWDLKRLLFDKLPREIAWRLPRSIRMWVVVKAAADACGRSLSPDQVTYQMMYATVDDPVVKAAVGAGRQ